MTIQDTEFLVGAIIALGLCALFIHKTGIARLFRVIGYAFIAAGDAVDHWHARYRELSTKRYQVEVKYAEMA